MSFLTTLSQEELKTFLKIIQDSLLVKRHQELHQWLNGEIQLFIPHDILITAWGDFPLRLIHTDIVSSLPGMRTTEIKKDGIMPFLVELFERWTVANRQPYALQFAEETFHFCYRSEEYDFGNDIGKMRSALVQGIKDERGRHDCLYVAMSDNSHFDAKAARAMEFLLPYIDSALRQVAHLPVQYPDLPEIKAEIEQLHDSASPSGQQAGSLWDLSQRESEIMHWVCLGKTNQEIGQILDISFFTVKNHLQRIFRKLDVLNRAQAVAKFERVASASGNYKAATQ